MNSYHEGDVYPVDVSNTTSPFPTPLPSDENSPISQVSAATNGAAASSIPGLTPRATARQIQLVLTNHELYLSDMFYSSQYDPNCLQYMLEFFRHVAQTIPTSPPSPTADGNQQPEAVPIEPVQGSSARDMLQDRAGIIVLREDLDYYVIPPRKDIEHAEMIEVKRAAGRALRQQDGIFSGLRKSEEPGTTEQHLIEMLTAG
jgi:ATP-binding cassette subfamily F protein 3